MLWLAVTLLLLSPPAGDEPQAVRVTTTLVAERIPIGPLRGSIELEVNALGARIEVRAPRDAAAVAARVSAGAGTVCPRVTAKPYGVELRCRTRRLDAIITTLGGKPFLDIHELRGLPWREGPNGPPVTHFEPFRAGLGSGCPGDTAIGRGECSLRDGKRLEAAMSFREALETRHRQMAAVRLGDIALVTGDPTTATGWYQRAGLLGVFGRVARARICEVDGGCLGSTDMVKRAFDSSGLSESVRADLDLRAVRAEAYQGRFDSAIYMLRDQMRSHGATNICRDSAEPICRRLVLEAMRFQMTVAAVDPHKDLHGATPAKSGADSDSETARKAAETRVRDARQLAEASIEVYMAMPGWDRGLLAIELASAAADLSGHVGAPIFGGNLLAVVAPQVPAAALPDYLLRAAELFLQGNEIARARVVVEYLSTRVGKQRGPQSPRWVAVQQSLATQLAEEEEGAGSSQPGKAAEPVDAAAVSQELTAAAAAIGRSKFMIGKLEAAAGPAQGKKK
ncbi:MAG TPA: hypothetical protein VFH73_17460 [Polyangia bacterium]|nr:hypothetical protein [Polyangia bacterium]